MYPPPTTISFLGTSLSESASVEDIILSPLISTPGIDVGIEPVAITIFFGRNIDRLLNENQKYKPSSPYSASKAAAHFVTQTVRAELAPYDVSVFGAYPGPTDTEMADGIDREKVSPASASNALYDGMEQGHEEIMTDDFAKGFVKRFFEDPKESERETAQFAHTAEKAMTNS